MYGPVSCIIYEKHAYIDRWKVWNCWFYYNNMDVSD